MVSFFLKIYDFLNQRQRVFIALLVALPCLLVLMISTLTYNENIYDFLPLTADNQKAMTVYQDISGGQRIVAMFKAKDTGKDADLAQEDITVAVDSFTRMVMEGDGHRHIKEITSQVDFEKYMGVTDFVYQNMPLFLCDSDYAAMERHLAAPDYAKRQLANDAEMMMMPTTGFFTTNVSNDPLGLFTPVMQRLQSQQKAMTFEIDNGYIFTQGRKYAIVLLTSPYGATESANNTLLINYVDSAVSHTMALCPDIEVAITGAPVISVDNARQIKTDSQWAISISVTLILLLLLYSFRRGKSLMLIGIAIAFGWLFAMGGIAVLRSNVSLIILGIGSIIIGIAVNYPIHFIAHEKHTRTAREVLKEMVTPLLIGNITTVGAFAALIPLDAPALRDLGIFAALMLIGTIAFVLIFLPHLIRKREVCTVQQGHMPFGRASSINISRSRWQVTVIVILTIVFGYFSLNTSFDANMSHINYLTPQQNTLLRELRASAGVTDTSNVYVVTEADTWDAALAMRSKLTPVLDSMKNDGTLNSYSDITMFIASKDEQSQRIEKWNNFWSKHRQQVLLAIEENAPHYGFSPDAFNGFHDILAREYSPKPFEYFEPLRSVLLSASFSTSMGGPSVIDVINAQGKDAHKIESRINTHTQSASQAYSFDFIGLNSAIARLLSDNFNYIGITCGLVVFLFLWISFGRLELSLLAFLPMALGWIWILGIMDICDIRFNIVNVILATFIFGQGDDYTIFMTDGLINEYAYRKKLLPAYKNSIIISALIMFIGMGSLIIARHPALHSLAEVTVVGMIIVVLMAWIIPPLVFRWIVMNGNAVRHVPVTLEQILVTLLATTIYVLELITGCLCCLTLRLTPCSKEKAEELFYRLTNLCFRLNVKLFWTIKTNIRNDHGETFQRGSVLICNHQSMLDPIFLYVLSPRIKVVVGRRVWRNPLVNPLFRLAGFINVDQPIERLRADIARAVASGYNVIIFPEGKRTHKKIERFHRGSFLIAKEIKADILPVYIHGMNHVMPRGSAFSCRGQIDIEIGKRVPYAELSTYGTTEMEITRAFRHQYVEHYKAMQRRIETAHYFHHYILYKYMYKGIGVERETRRLLKRYDDFSAWIDTYDASGNPSGQVTVLNAGRGQFSLLFAIVHPDVEVFSYSDNEDDTALLNAIEPRPHNLHVCRAANHGKEESTCQPRKVYNMKEIVK